MQPILAKTATSQFLSENGISLFSSSFGDDFTFRGFILGVSQLFYLVLLWSFFVLVLTVCVSNADPAVWRPDATFLILFFLRRTGMKTMLTAGSHTLQNR